MLDCWKLPNLTIELSKISFEEIILKLKKVLNLSNRYLLITWENIHLNQDLVLFFFLVIRILTSLLLITFNLNIYLQRHFYIMINLHLGMIEILIQ